MATRDLDVNVSSDHIERLAGGKRPIPALAELVWNALDADATEVSVRFELNDLDTLQEVRVTDNGHGILPEEFESTFGSLGGSWKKLAAKTREEGRLLHGRNGQGRFKAFVLGDHVEWTTRAKSKAGSRETRITLLRSNPKKFKVSETKETGERPGTCVRVFNLHSTLDSFTSESATDSFTDFFAIYLLQYPSVAITYDGAEVAPNKLIADRRDYKLGDFEHEGRAYPATLSVIEWYSKKPRTLYLCNQGGFTLAETKPGIQAPGLNFTAYIRSEYLTRLDEKGLLQVEDLHSGLKSLLDAAKSSLREYSRERTAEKAQHKVAEWKERKIYPFKDEPTTETETTERQVFDILALNVSEFSPGFDETDDKNQALSFRLLREAIEESPEATQRIISEVLELPKEKQDELAQLLDRTSLSSIINASKEVADRLDFVRGLELLVFDHTSKKQLLERKELHRILARHVWVFGEQFSLAVDDESLTEVLRKHYAQLGRDLDDDEKVKRLDGSDGIVDLMLSGIVPQSDASQREHLVIELKRPCKKLDQSVVNQIENYALAVSSDERFRDTNTKWTFIAVCNELTDYAKKRAKQRDRPRGLIHDDDEGNYKVWVFSWSQIIEGTMARLQFFKERLNYNATRDDAIRYLNETHQKYVPNVFRERQEQSDG